MSNLYILTTIIIIASVILNVCLLISFFKVRCVKIEYLKKKIQNPEKAFSFGIAANELERRGEKIDEAKERLFELSLSGGPLTRWRAWSFAKRHFPMETEEIDFSWLRPTEQSKDQIRKVLTS